MDLGTLLRNQSLERFEAAFRDNGIDESVLPHLTQDHLRELGLPLGARIKLLAAIAGLAKETKEQLPPPATVLDMPVDTAERRQIRFGRRCGRVQWKVDSRRFILATSRRLSEERRNRNSCGGAGRKQRLGKARSC